MAKPKTASGVLLRALLAHAGEIELDDGVESAAVDCAFYDDDRFSEDDKKKAVRDCRKVLEDLSEKADELIAVGTRSVDSAETLLKETLPVIEKHQTPTEILATCSLSSRIQRYLATFEAR